MPKTKLTKPTLSEYVTDQLLHASSDLENAFQDLYPESELYATEGYFRGLMDSDKYLTPVEHSECPRGTMNPRRLELGNIVEFKGGALWTVVHIETNEVGELILSITSSNMKINLSEHDRVWTDMRLL